MPIQVLSTHLVNKIAAGEVIERPASVVKELVENSLDSGATRIDVAIEDGGKKLISVRDNGSGMSAEDLRLAFAPHATSKIAREEDLYEISTMGFRGEALASIASVSHAHIRTRRGQASDAGGHEVEASGDTLGEVRPCASADGTTATIRDIFFNTPGRRKFMKTAATELGYVSDQLARLSLPNPGIAFTLTHNGREILNLPAAASTVQRASDLFGAELVQNVLTVSRKGQSVQVKGFVAPPAAARASAKWQYFFVNGRYVRDRLLAHALKEAYRGLLEPTRFPLGVIFIEIPAAEIDVNVHPTKIEVRFRDSQLVHGELLAALREGLNSASLTPSASLDSAARRAGAQSCGEPQTDAQQSHRESLQKALADFFKSTPPQVPHFGATGGNGGNEKSPELGEARPIHQPATATSVLSTATGGKSMPSTIPTAGAYASQNPSANCAATETDTRSYRAMPVPVGSIDWAVQMHNRYIVYPCDDGIAIVDQHALHERIIYEELKSRLRQSPLVAQRVLIPEPFRVTAAESALLQRHSQLLGRIGIEVSPFSPQTAAVQQFPMMLMGRGVNTGQFVREMLDKLPDWDSDQEQLLEGVLQMISCKSAIKAGDPLGDEEIHDLIERAKEVENSSSCPHGRPTTIKLTVKELDKLFKRT